jgi:hypothetical protein
MCPNHTRWLAFTGDESFSFAALPAPTLPCTLCSKAQTLAQSRLLLGDKRAEDVCVSAHDVCSDLLWVHLHYQNTTQQQQQWEKIQDCHMLILLWIPAVYSLASLLSQASAEEQQEWYECVHGRMAVRSILRDTLWGCFSTELHTPHDAREKERNEKTWRELYGETWLKKLP